MTSIKFAAIKSWPSANTRSVLQEDLSEYMKYNPFKPNSVVAPVTFAGRYNEIKALEKGLFQTHHGNPVHLLIEGERGIGKSSLLRLAQFEAQGDIQIDEETPPFNFITLSIELQDGMSSADIVRRLALEMKAQIDKNETLKAKAAAVWGFLKKWEVLGVRFHEDPDGPSLDPIDQLYSFTNQVIELLRVGGEDLDGVMILIDEADKPNADAGLGALVKLFTERLSKNQCDRVMIVLSGLPDLLDKLGESHESSPRIFSIHTLGPLNKEDAKSVVRKGIDEANEKNPGRMTYITDEGLDTIVDLSEGYPHFIQQFSYCAFESDSDDHIDRDDVMEGSLGEGGALDQLGRKFFSRMYYDDIGSDDYRTVLDTMAGSSDNFVVKKDIISASGLDESIVSNAVRTLTGRGIIVRDDTRRGYYRLPNVSFATWIRAKSFLSSHLERKADSELPFSDSDGD